MAFRILAAYSFIPAAALQATDKTEVKKIQFPNFIKNHSSELSAGCGLVVGFIGNIFLKQVRSKDGTKRIPQQDDIKGNPYQSVENFKKIIFLLCDFLAKDQNLIEFEEIKDSLPKEISGECIIKIGELNESLRNIEENSKKLENELTVTRNFINSNNNSQQKVDNSTVNKIKLENSELNSRLEIQKKENSNLNEKIQELEQQISKQQKEHDDSNKSLRQELENKKKSYEELKLQLDLVKNNSETITKQLNEKNDNLQKELDFLKSENENSDGLENLDQEYSKKMSMLQKEKSRLEEEKNRLEEEKNRLEVENVQIKVLNNDLDGQNKLLQKEKDSFLSKNENFEKEKQNLEQKNEEIENNFKILKEESNKLVSKVSEFKKKVLLNEQQIQKLNDAVSCKDQQITSLNTKIENLKAEIFTKDQQIELQITKQESSSDMTNIKETYEEMFKLKDKLRELERNNSKNQNEIKRIADLFCSVLQEFEFQKTNSNLEYFYNYIGNKINTLNNSIDYPDAESFKKILEMFQKIINFSFYCESNFELKKSQVKYLVNKIVSQSSLNELVLSEDILNNIDNDEVMNKFGEFLQISLSEIENLIKEQKDIIREENFDFAGFKALLLLRSTKQSEMFEGVLKMSQYLKDPLNFANFENEKEKIISYLKEIKSCGVFGEQLAINLESNYEISKSLLQIQSSYPEQTIVRSDIPNYLNEYFKILNCIPVFQKNFGNSFNDSSIIGLLEDYYAILRQFNDSFPEVAYDNIPSFLLQYSEFLNMSNSIAGLEVSPGINPPGNLQENTSDTATSLLKNSFMIFDKDQKQNRQMNYSEAPKHLSQSMKLLEVLETSDFIASLENNPQEGNSENPQEWNLEKITNFLNKFRNTGEPINYLSVPKHLVQLIKFLEILELSGKLKKIESWRAKDDKTGSIEVLKQQIGDSSEYYTKTNETCNGSCSYGRAHLICKKSNASPFILKPKNYVEIINGFLNFFIKGQEDIVSCRENFKQKLNFADKQMKIDTEKHSNSFASMNRQLERRIFLIKRSRILDIIALLRQIYNRFFVSEKPLIDELMSNGVDLLDDENLKVKVEEILGDPAEFPPEQLANFIKKEMHRHMSAYYCMLRR